MSDSRFPSVPQKQETEMGVAGSGGPLHQPTTHSKIQMHETFIVARRSS